MIDIFVAVLLISAIGYGMVLNRRIVALRRDQADLERLAISFHEATSRAEASVGNLKNAAQSSSQILNEGIDEAVKIRDDLNFLIDRGERLGDQLEKSVRGIEGANRPLKPVLNPVEPANEIIPVDIGDLGQDISDVSPKMVPALKRNGNNDFNAEALGNEIVKSEAERDLIRALQAVR